MRWSAGRQCRSADIGRFIVADDLNGGDLAVFHSNRNLDLSVTASSGSLIDAILVNGFIRNNLSLVFSFQSNQRRERFQVLLLGSVLLVYELFTAQ